MRCGMKNVVKNKKIKDMSLKGAARGGGKSGGSMPGGPIPARVPKAPGAHNGSKPR